MAKLRGGDRFVERLHPAIARVPPERRADAEAALRDVAASGATSLTRLVELFRDRARDRSVRRNAGWLLCLLPDDRAGAALLEALVDRAFDLREDAAWALGHRREKRFAPPLVRLFADRSEDPAVRAAVARAFAVLGSRRPLRALAAALAGDPDPTVQEAAAYGLAFLWDPRAFDPLVHALGGAGELPAVRAQAAEGLANLRAVRAVPALLAALGDPAPEVRFWASFALGALGGA